MSGLAPRNSSHSLKVTLKRAIEICIRRVWYVLDSNEPTGPKWEVVFRKRLS